MNCHPAIARTLVALVALPMIALAQQPRGAKVFISVDMEGLAGVVTASDVNASGPDYAYFRAIMAAETNAAIEGAFRAGATEVLVRDSHGSKQNLLPGDVDRYGRTVAVCHVGSEDLDRWMVEQGWAVAFRKYSLDYVDAENDAREAGRGIWQGEFEMPLEWRAARRNP